MVELLCVPAAAATMQGIPNSTPHKIRLNEEMLTRVLPNATARQASSRKFVPVSKLFTKPAGQAVLLAPTPDLAAVEAGARAAWVARQAAANQLAHQLLEQLQYQPTAGSSSTTSGMHLKQPSWPALPDKLLLFCMSLMHKAGLTTYYGQYTAQQQNDDTCTATTHAAAAAQLEAQLSSSAIRNMLRFDSGIGAGPAAAAGQLALIESSLADAAARVWAAGSLHKLNARWMRVMSRVEPHVVLSLLRGFQCLPPGMRVTATSWQLQGQEWREFSSTEQQREQEMWSPAARAAQWDVAEKTMAVLAAKQPAPWLGTCTGDGRGGWQALTAVGADEEGRKGGELHLLPCLRRGQRGSAVLAAV
jgi:hypothetical protein